MLLEKSRPCAVLCFYEFKLTSTPLLYRHRHNTETFRQCKPYDFLNMLYQALSTRAGSLRAASTISQIVRSKHTLPKLQYEYSALEPAISAEIMELHHSKHHQTYVNGLNAAEDSLKQAVEAGDVKKAIELQPALKFNGGGHLNHTLFWENLAPTKQDGGRLPDGGFEFQCCTSQDQVLRHTTDHADLS